MLSDTFWRKYNCCLDYIHLQCLFRSQGSVIFLYQIDSQLGMCAKHKTLTLEARACAQQVLQMKQQNISFVITLQNDTYKG